jgi:hypothetical protein
VRVALGEDQLHRLRVHEGDEPEHALLLVGNAHVVDGAVDATVQMKNTVKSRRSSAMMLSSALASEHGGLEYLK